MASPPSRTTPGPPAKAIVRIDHAALLRGLTIAGETCEIVGVGPVPVPVVREWMARGDLFLTAIITKGADVAAAVHLGRRPTALQQTALEWLHTQCCIEACARPPTEWDHHHDWHNNQQTCLPNLGGMCDHDHHLKSHKHYRLVPSPAIPGKYRLLPPPDPHPPDDG